MRKMSEANAKAKIEESVESKFEGVKARIPHSPYMRKEVEYILPFGEGYREGISQ